MTINSKSGNFNRQEPRSKAERRKNFDPRKWASKYLNSGGLPQRISVPNDDGEIRMPKTMTNEDRKKMGNELDPDLEPVACDKCSTLSATLKLAPIDQGQGVRYFYYCDKCK